MSYLLVNNNVGTLSLSASGSAILLYDLSDRPDGGVYLDNVSCGSVGISLAGKSFSIGSCVWQDPYIYDENHVIIGGGDVHRGHTLRWDGGGGPGSFSPDEAIVVIDGGGGSFSVSCSGTLRRYADFTQNASGGLYPGKGRVGSAANIMGASMVTVKDVYTSLHWVVSMGGQTVEFDTTYPDGATNQQIEASCSLLYPDGKITYSDGVYTVEEGLPNKSVATSMTTYASATYSRSTGVCACTRSDSCTVYDYGGSGGYLTAEVNVGNGSVSLRAACTLEDSHGKAMAAIHDYCGAYTVDYAGQVQNMDGEARNDIVILTNEKHVGDTELIEFDSDGGTITYTGMVSFLGSVWDSSGTEERFLNATDGDLPNSIAALTDYLEHGHLIAKNVPSVWGETAQNDYVESGFVVQEGYGNIMIAAGVAHIGGNTATLSEDAYYNHPDSRDIYIDIDSSATLLYTVLANGATAPAIASGTLRLAKVVTGENLAIISITDLRVFKNNYTKSGEHPSHPCWQPFPQQMRDDNGNPMYTSDGEPLWATDSPAYYDTEILVRCSDFDTADALQFDFVSTGLVANPPLQFITPTWAANNCTTDVVDSTQHVTVGEGVTAAYIEDSDMLSDNIRLTGTRFAVVKWRASVNGATAKLNIGQHRWDLVYDEGVDWESGGSYKQGDHVLYNSIVYTCMHAVGSSTAPDLDLGCWLPYHASFIDLCRPDSAGEHEVSTQQSIIPYEQPFDKRLWDDVDERAKRNNDSTYDWEFPAGWGVGRIVSLKIECPTPDCEYWLEHVRLYRRTSAEGGFAAVFVLPHQPAWNDIRDIYDPAWPSTGVITHDPASGYPDDEIATIPKLYLIVDGAVIWELYAGICSYHQAAPPDYDMVYTFLPERIRNISAPGSGWGGCPQDDYATPANFPLNGVVTITPKTSWGQNAWAQENDFATWLESGIHYADANGHVGLDLQPWVSAWSHFPGSTGKVNSFQKQYRGQIWGLAWKTNGRPGEGDVQIATPNASPSYIETTTAQSNACGFFQSVAVNTEGMVTARGGGDEKPTSLYVANRLWTRVAGLIVSAGKIALDHRHSRKTGVGALAMATADRISVFQTYDCGMTHSEERVLELSSDVRSPCVFEVPDGRGVWGIAWTSGSDTKAAYSRDGFISKEVKTLLANVKNVRVVAHPLTGVVMAVGLNSDSNLVAYRSHDAALTFFGPYTIASAVDEQTPALDAVADAHGSWRVMYQNANGDNLQYYSLDNGEHWQSLS
ncbi:MAG: hypothetical protein ABFD83_14760 [Armatimonadota bacterium]